MSVVYVAVGVIFNSNEEICIAKRPEGKHLAGFWEFPGGKVEAGETTFEALQRELNEELGITILDSHPLIKIEFQYPEKQVVLDVHCVKQFNGNANGKEGQAVTWVPRNELSQYRFPEANEAILAAIGDR